MNIIAIKDQLKRIDQLIRMKATGTPQELAEKLSISERTIYRLIKQLKELGAPIYFDPIRNSYCYNQKCTFSISFELNTDKLDLVDNRKLRKKRERE